MKDQKHILKILKDIQTLAYSKDKSDHTRSRMLLNDLIEYMEEK